VIFLLVLGGEFLRLFVQDLAFDRGMSWGALLPAFVSFLLWPVLYLLLSRLKVQFRVE